MTYALIKTIIVRRASHAEKDGAAFEAITTRTDSGEIVVKNAGCVSAVIAGAAAPPALI